MENRSLACSFPLTLLIPTRTIAFELNRHVISKPKRPDFESLRNNFLFLCQNISPLHLLKILLVHVDQLENWKCWVLQAHTPFVSPAERKALPQPHLMASHPHCTQKDAHSHHASPFLCVSSQLPVHTDKSTPWSHPPERYTDQHSCKRARLAESTRDRPDTGSVSACVSWPLRLGCLSSHPSFPASYFWDLE